MAKQIIYIDELITEYLEVASVNMTKKLFEGKFDDGTTFQIQVIVTTDEDEFIEDTGLNTTTHE